MSTVRAGLPTISVRRGPEAITVLRAAARVAVAIGVVLAGFVMYQFGVTSVLATRAQPGLTADLAHRIVTVPVSSVVYETPGTPAPPAPFEAPAPSQATAVEPMLLVEEVPERGEAAGRITIPAAGVDWTFVEGVSRAELKSGVGHMPGTAFPGQPGNAVISGHRTTYGAPFLHLDRVEVGDEIAVETATGMHRYAVTAVLVVDPTDTWVTTQWEGGWLTLTTCEPVLSASHRLVVVAALVDGPNAGVILGGP